MAGEIETICKDRLGEWQHSLVQEHSTPILLVGVGHDESKGHVVLCIPKELSDDEVMQFLQGALNMLKLGRRIIYL